MKHERMDMGESGEGARRTSEAARDDDLSADLEVASRLREVLLTQTLGELKVPLANIALAASVLDRKLSAASRVELGLRAWVDDVRDAVMQAVLLVDALRGAVDETLPEADLRACATLSILDAAVQVVRPLTRARRVRVVTELREGAEQLHCDRALTLRALVALLTHSLRRTAVGGRVRLAVAHTGLATHLSVIDEGELLPEHEVEALLAHAVDDGRGPLGRPVFIAHRAVVVQGGTLAVRPDADRRMLFDISLPAPM